MKFLLPKIKQQAISSWRFVLSVIWMIPVLQLTAQTCGPTVTGDDFVCPAQTEVYTAVRGEAGSTLSWNLSGGGTIVGLANNNTEATIEWNDLTTGGGPFFLTVTESSAACSETLVYAITIESENIYLACNDLVYVALDENCQAVITPDMILEDPQYEDDSYTIHLSEQNGNPIPGDVIDIQYLHEVINVTIEHNCSGLTCWGTVSVQDNIAPGLVCRDDVIEIACDESYTPEHIGFPLPPTANIVKIKNNEYSVIVPGDCGGAYKLVFADVFENLNCGDAYDFLVTRTWIATDASGNTTSCEETIGAVWGSLIDMELPPHYDGLTQYLNHLPKLQCSFAGLPYYWPHEYNPGPEVTGYPQWSGCSNIQYYYEDLVFPICGNTRKIVRHWLVLDWCTGEDFVYDQLIIIVDNAGPVVTAVRDTLYYPTSPGECFGTAYPIPAPIVLFDCSDWTYTISYKLRDESGNPFEQAITDNVFEGPEGFGITDLPVDTTWVMYTITDACGNSTQAFTEIVIEDYESPTAVCDKHTVVTLTEDGTAKIFAASLDDGSNDNCAIDRFEVRRMDTPCDHPEDLLFGDFVNFCCEDVGESILVVFRVYDTKGYFSDCMVEVLVQDKMPPTISYCPPDVSLDCGTDYTDTSLTGGEPIVDDNCDNVTLEYRDVEYLDDCGRGYIRRDWKATDAGGRVVTCRQYIYLVDNNPLSFDDIDWPGDVVLHGCQQSDFNPDITGRPVVNNTACKNIGIAYTDQYVNQVEGACYKILREWKVADWCESPPYQYITYTQVIMVVDNTVPTFTSCQDITVDSDNSLCDALVTVTASATDDCTPQNELEYTWQVDYDRDGTIDDSGDGNAFSRVFPYGRHWVYFYVSDGCGSTANCRLTVRVRDTKDPTPLCLAKITTTMMSTGSLPVKASTFNLCQCSYGSYDNCTPKELLRFSFSSNVNDTVRVFTCDDITNGVAESFPLEMWVTDLDGNQDFCNVTLVIMDNVHACPDAMDASASISGFIIDEMTDGMPAFEVELEKDGVLASQEMTDQVGQYVFEDLDVYRKYRLKPRKDNDPANGVSTLDLVMIQKHLLGLYELNSPYKLIAADANNTGSISAADLLEIRNLVLGVTEEFSKTDSWRFIDGKYEFENPQEPWGFQEDFTIEELYIDSDSVNFIAIKVGDVNNSAVEELGGNSLEPRSGKNLVLQSTDLLLKAGEEFTIPVMTQGEQWIEGMQFTIAYNPALITDVELMSGKIGLNRQNVHYFPGTAGKITVSWNAQQSMLLKPGEHLFLLKGKAIGTNLSISRCLEMNSSYTRAEAYDTDYTEMDLRLDFVPVDTEMLTLYQNVPNPFANETEVRFYLPKDSYIQFTVFDHLGKTIHEYAGHYSKGTNSITLNKELFATQGIYFYQLTSGDDREMRKMLFTR